MTAFNDPAKVAKREKGRVRVLLKRVATNEASANEAREAVELALKHGKPLEAVADVLRAVQVNAAKQEVDELAAVLHPEASNVLYARRMAQWQERKPITQAEWLEGVGSASQYGWGYDAATLVRRKGDRLETSRGAEVPFKHAVAAYLKAQQCRELGTTWHRNGEKVAVGVYQLDAIDAEGNIRAGCHTIGFAEMQRLAIREVPHLVRASFPVPALIAA
jgi:hypothetical protein